MNETFIPIFADGTRSSTEVYVVVGIPTDKDWLAVVTPKGEE